MNHCLLPIVSAICNNPSVRPVFLLPTLFSFFLFAGFLCRCDSSPEMCICITCQSWGSKPRCYLIDVWICLTKRDRLSHGSVRQNMCEQKWGHLGRIRNCEDKEGKNNVINYRVLICMFVRVWESMWEWAIKDIFATTWVTFCVHTFLCPCMDFCMENWKRRGDCDCVMFLHPDKWSAT